jgi:Kef-type K+ transport system membrane component KefB
MPGPSRVSIAAAYALMIGGAVLGFLLVRSYGQLLIAPASSVAVPVAPANAAASDVLLRVLIALAAVTVTGLALGRLFAYVGQPAVIGEVVAGIVLGPSLLGPELSAHVLPPVAAPYLGVIAQLGIILYMFIVGLDLNADLVRRRAHATVVISHASIVVPFLLGSGLALHLYPRLSHGGVPFTSFALFLGVALSITAFPVLARILADRDLSRTPLGVMALSCAAIDDVTAWCLLAFVVGVAKAKAGEAVFVVLGTLVFAGVMVLIVRPLLTRLSERWREEPLPAYRIAFVFVSVLVSALVTELIGIHAIFGAFLLGAVIPHDSVIARALSRQLEPVVTVLFLPAFFAFTGMRTHVGLLSGVEAWSLCALIIAVAIAGKFGGTFVAARLTGLPSRPATALGVLMNTRGLMELIVLNVGLDLGVISPALFAMMVLMALVTTLMTGPLLKSLGPGIQG